jgi:transposase
MQRGRKSSLEERIEIGERGQAGQTDRQIAQAMGFSVWTVRKWRRNYQRRGRAGLSLRLGRPPTGALGQFPKEMRQVVQQMRQQHPGWGPLTILTELENDPSLSGVKLPQRSRLAAFLKQAGLTRKYERHSDLPQSQASGPEHAHQEWEMDAQGVIKVPQLGSVSVINISDLFSRLKIESYPCLDTSHPRSLDYQLVLRRAFVHYGLPERLSLDHDSVFYDNASASPYPTTLHLWLIALGIEVYFIQHRPPTEHSVIERTHQTITRQAITGQDFDEDRALQQQLTQRLDFLNTRFPSRTLGGQPPLLACPAAQHSGRTYRLEWETELLQLQRVETYLAQGRWFRQTSAQGQFSLGAFRYNVGQTFSHQSLEITFEPQTRQLNCLSPDGHQVWHFPIQGLTKADLMGELSPLMALPVYQLGLPFSPSAWRQMTLANDMTGTTL